MCWHISELAITSVKEDFKNDSAVDSGGASPKFGGSEERTEREIANLLL